MCYHTTRCARLVRIPTPVQRFREHSTSELMIFAQPEHTPNAHRAHTPRTTQPGRTTRTQPPQCAPFAVAWAGVGFIWLHSNRLREADLLANKNPFYIISPRTHYLSSHAPHPTPGGCRTGERSRSDDLGS